LKAHLKVGPNSRGPEAAGRLGPSTGRDQLISSRGRFLFWHAWFPLALFGGLVALFETTDLDLYLSDLFFDFHRGAFFWKDTWWAKDLIHTGGRLAVAGFGICLGLLWVASFLRKAFCVLTNWRAALVFSIITMAAGPATVACLKVVVNRPYPEHIKRYGGKLEYTRVLEGSPLTEKHYGGFPAAHSAAGYGLFGLYFVLGERRPKLALWGLALALALGTLFAFGQQVRGMHYASHNVWSAAICWFEALALYLGAFRGRLAGRASRAGVTHPAPRLICRNWSRGVAAFLSASSLRRLIFRRIWPPGDACPLPRSASASLRPRGLPPGPNPGKSKRLRQAAPRNAATL